MVRWLGLVLALGLVAAPAEAQVFKPKGKKTETTKKAPKKAPKKAQKAPAKKAKAAKARKSRERTRSDDDGPRSKRNDPDFVKITDDDEIE